MPLTNNFQDAERDLGIIISDDGSFEPQVNASIARANKVLGKMRNTFKYFTSDIVKILYPVYIRPHLEFAAPVWNALSKEDLKKLETFQRKATRYATDLNGLDYKQRLEALKLTTIKDRRIRGDLIQYFKIKNGHDDIRLLKEPKLQKSKRPHDQKIYSFTTIHVKRLTYRVPKAFLCRIVSFIIKK